jgi:hypothetical protein
MMKITNLNVYALADCIKAGNGVIHKVAPTDAPHLKRCITAGLLAKGTDKGTWILSDAGKTAVDAYNARNGR